MKILLIGIGGTYNYGCEAIVRGTTELLRQAIPGVSVYYASIKSNQDSQILHDCPITIVDRILATRYSFSQLSNKLYRKLNIRYECIVDDKKLINDYDCIFSIGGDLYTLNEKSQGFPFYLMRFGDYCVKYNKKFVLWGASVGPFSANKSLERQVMRHLSKLTAITVREKMTYDYLFSNNVKDNVMFVPDPAFSVFPDIVKQTPCNKQPKKIAINLSPLSARYSSLSYEDMLTQQAKVIIELIDDFTTEVLFVPHVSSENLHTNDNDYLYLEKLYRRLPIAYQGKVHLLPASEGFLATKKHLIDCDLCIASRMHCAINALTARVPTILLSYSAKAKGMCEYVYGSDKFVIPLSDFSQICRLIKEIDFNSTHTKLNRIIPEIQRLSLNNVHTIFDKKLNLL